MASAAGYSQLTRQHPIATPFPPAQRGHAPRPPRSASLITNWYLSTGVWFGARQGKPGRWQTRFTWICLFGRGIVKLKPLHTASLEGYSVSGRAPWAWFSQATLFTSRAVTSLFPVVTFQSLKVITTWTACSHFNGLQFLNTTKLSVHSAFAHLPHISHPNVLVSQLELNTQS